MFSHFSQLASNFWVMQSDFYSTNSGIFLDNGQACLIDAGIYPGEICAIRSFLKEMQCMPKWMVLTHCHWDHILGPEHFPEVKIIAQEKYLSRADGISQIRICRQVEEWETQQGLKREQSFSIPQPDETFDQNLTLKIGNLPLEFFHAPGHSEDHLIVYQPGGKILWAGDMLSDVDIPYICDQLDNYQRTLALLKSLDIEVLVPGHGKPTKDSTEINTRMEEDIIYSSELHNRVKQQIRQGSSIDETVNSCMDMAYRNQIENERPHRLNIESVYQELCGQAQSSKRGWLQWMNEV
ncbi:MAG: MBL fold metallo-hydrolase [Anaerolineaceae bacterium]|nr:MBL fold metallo-hydrolase [Anaerolineaceae bacterium]